MADWGEEEEDDLYYERPPAVQNLQVGWTAHPVATAGVDGGFIVLDWDDGAYLHYADTHISRGVPGVYIWSAMTFSGDAVAAVYVGESSNIRDRLDDYLRANAIFSSKKTEGRLVAEMSEYIQRGHLVRVSLVCAKIDDRDWIPASKAECLLVESAIVVHTLTKGGIRVLNKAAFGYEILIDNEIHML